MHQYRDFDKEYSEGKLCVEILLQIYDEEVELLRIVRYEAIAEDEEGNLDM